MAASESPVLYSSEKTVASAGTAEPLVASSKRVKSVVIIAKAGNTSQVYVGGADVDSSTNDGLDAGESITLESHEWMDLADIYIDAGTSDDGVDFYAVKALGWVWGNRGRGLGEEFLPPRP
jgi:hypothetical protein